MDCAGGFQPLAEGDARAHVTCEQRQHCTPLVISHVLPLLMFSVLQFSNSHWSEKSPFQMYLYVLVIICNIDKFY